MVEKKKLTREEELQKSLAEADARFNTERKFKSGDDWLLFYEKEKVFAERMIKLIEGGALKND